MNFPKILPIWRSMLFVPVNVEKFVDKAHTRGADSIILDIEDAVAPDQKEHARSMVKKAAELVGRGGGDVLVRINRPWRMAIKDLEATICPSVQALWLPKVEGPEHIHILSEITSELELEQGMEPGTTKFLAKIETPAGFLRMRDIAIADERVVAIGLGAGDFSLSTGIHPDSEGFIYPNVEVVITAQATGRVPLGLVSTIIDFTDLVGFRNIVQRSRKLGLQGSGCIHPNQVPILNEEFTPTEQEVTEARELVSVFEEAMVSGKGAIKFKGKMVDYRSMVGAKALIEKYEVIMERNESVTKFSKC